MADLLNQQLEYEKNKTATFKAAFNKAAEKLKAVEERARSEEQALRDQVQKLQKELEEAKSSLQAAAMEAVRTAELEIQVAVLQDVIGNESANKQKTQAQHQAELQGLQALAELTSQIPHIQPEELQQAHDERDAALQELKRLQDGQKKLEQAHAAQLQQAQHESLLMQVQSLRRAEEAKQDLADSVRSCRVLQAELERTRAAGAAEALKLGETKAMLISQESELVRSQNAQKKASQLAAELERLIGENELLASENEQLQSRLIQSVVVEPEPDYRDELIKQYLEQIKDSDAEMLEHSKKMEQLREQMAALEQKHAAELEQIALEKQKIEQQLLETEGKLQKQIEDSQEMASRVRELETLVEMVVKQQ